MQGFRQTLRNILHAAFRKYCGKFLRHHAGGAVSAEMAPHAVAHDAQHPAGGGKAFNHVFLLTAFADPLGGSAVQGIRGGGGHAAGGLN